MSDFSIETFFIIARFYSLHYFVVRLSAGARVERCGGSATCIFGMAHSMILLSRVLSDVFSGTFGCGPVL